MYFLRMEELISKIWLLACFNLFISFVYSQDIRPLPISSRKRLPTVIITREHLRQRQNSYGAHGDTAAEFVVSAGLDTSRNSAVRIRRIGHRPVNGTSNPRPNVFNIPHVNGTRRVIHTNIRLHPQYRTPSFKNPYESNSIPNTHLSLDRRHHLNEGEKNIQILNRRYHVDGDGQRFRSPNGGFYQNANRNPAVPDRIFTQYRPPIFVPNFQQNRRSDANSDIAAGVNKRIPNVAINEGPKINSFSNNDQLYPIVNVKYSSSSVTASVSRKEQPTSSSENNENLNKMIPGEFKLNNKQDFHREATLKNNPPAQSQNNSSHYIKIKPPADSSSTDHLYIQRNNLSIYAYNHSDISDKESTRETHLKVNKTVNENRKSEKTENPFHNEKEDQNLKERPNNDNERSSLDSSVIKPTNSEENVLSETPPSQSNSDKIRQIQTLLIRKPSLILRDQITVNELPKNSNRPRYGPRSLALIDEMVSLSRRKREATYSDVEKSDTYNLPEEETSSNTGNESDDILFSTNFSETGNLGKSQRQSRYNSQNFRTHSAPGEVNTTSSLEKPSFPMAEEESRVAPVYEMFSDGTYDTSEELTESDIMSFSDFLASPMADKIRLERQLLFKNANVSTGNASAEDPPFSEKIDARSSKNSTMVHLRNLVAAKLLDSILSLSNISMNDTKILKSERSSDGLTSAEQRHIGIMVTPYEGQENEDAPVSRPVIRILKGRIISLPDLPQELIPIIMGTYKPTYTEPEEPMYNDDAKLTESILDNAIFKLLQTDELLSLQPVVRKSPRPVTYKMSRKSPSTNYVGSLKTNEPTGKTKFIYKPNEWSLDPRCDRLTEEICLDDSDYPSSAIMSSIYKDKAKFDLMYAEVKVHESQVEGLSRQQESAYSFDHYYGSYPQASGSHLIPRDYGPHGGFVCPSEVHYAKPHRAKNRKGEWKVVVNVGEYTQTLRMEKCLSSGNPCKYVVNHMQSTCAQVYSYHRLLVFSKERGLHIDVFRAPAACTCYLRPARNSYGSAFAASSPYLMRPNPYEEYGGHVETAPALQVHTEGSTGNKDKKKNSFSNTLWAILGGGQQASTLAQQPQFLDEVQKQISWTQQLSKFPQLVKQISPNQVLKQLLEEEDEEYGIRRQRIRKKYPLDQSTSGGLGNHQMPLVIPLLPPPPPPPAAIPRRPIVSITPTDQKHIFALSPDNQSKIIAFSSAPEPTKIFSLTKGSNVIKNSIRPNGDSNHRNIYIINQQPFNRVSGYKVQPGMYPPQSENVQIPEASLLPVAPQFSPHPENPLKPIMKPMPAPRGSNKDIVEDDDLVAAEKSVGDAMHDFAVETLTDTRAVPQEDSESKINFSYHPILEYLNV